MVHRHGPLLTPLSPRRNHCIPIAGGIAAAGPGGPKDHTAFLLLFQRAVDGALGVPLRGGGALVIELFALAQAEFDLDPAVFEVER